VSLPRPGSRSRDGDLDVFTCALSEGRYAGRVRAQSSEPVARPAGSGLHSLGGRGGQGPRPLFRSPRRRVAEVDDVDGVDGVDGVGPGSDLAAPEFRKASDAAPSARHQAARSEAS